MEDLSVEDKVVGLLNQVLFLQSEKERVSALTQVQELVLHREPQLVSKFHKDIIAFQGDRNADVRKWVVGFIEEACKKNSELYPQLLPTVQRLLEDEAVSVVKRCLQAAAPLYRSAMVWITQSSSIGPDMELSWIILSGMKGKIVAMLDHDNDGVRTQVIKFMEALILLQTFSEQHSQQRDREPTFCLDNIPLTLKLMRPRKLEDEAKEFIAKLLDFQGSVHISSVNLMTVMSSITILAKARPESLMGNVVEAMQKLHKNLPPTLSKLQVNSVHKHLKMQLLHILKHPLGMEYHDTLVSILHDLGMTNSELKKTIGNREELRKMSRKRAAKNENSEKDGDDSARKRPRLQPHNTSPSSNFSFSSLLPGLGGPSSLPPGVIIKQEKEDAFPSFSYEEKSKEEADEKVVNWVLKRLNIDTVVDIVVETMLKVPSSMPDTFSQVYEPVNNAGSEAQKLTLSKQLAVQLKNNVTPELLAMPTLEKTAVATKDFLSGEGGADSDDESPLVFLGSTRPIQYVPPPVLPPAPIAPLRPKIRTVKLSQVTPVLTGRQQSSLQLMLSKRLIRNTGTVQKKNWATLGNEFREKLMSTLLTMASDEEVKTVESIVLADPSSHSQLLEWWLFNLHASASDFTPWNKLLSDMEEPESRTEYQSYKAVLFRVVRAMVANVERQETLLQSLSQLLLTVPSLPLDIVPILMESVVGSSAQKGNASMVAVIGPLLSDLALWRSSVSQSIICVMCSLATHDNQQISDRMLSELQSMLSSEVGVSDYIVEMAKKHLDYLAEPQPPTDLFADHLGRSEEQKQWEENTVKACLNLPLSILPTHQTLIHDLAGVYVRTVNEAKRGILRLLEQPVSEMGMESTELLSLVRNTPKGGETLITRIIHVLTEKSPPSDALVCQVRELYNKRVSDVRFLIPVLTGLSQKEIIAVLPKLIKLNPHVVKEVFNRLWGITLDSGVSPLTPVDLMVALHLIDADKCDVKTVMRATNMCFQEPKIYTAEVLGVVLQQLMEESHIPTLLMRTVIMTLTHHPKLLSFIISVLTRLIDKQIWLQSSGWEGFMKCCERALPQSLTVVVQLPPEPLRKALTNSSALKKAFKKHLSAPQQDLHVPQEVFDVLEVQQTESHESPDRRIDSPRVQQAAA